MYKLPIKFLWCLILVCACLFPQLTKASAYWMEIHGSGKLNMPVKIQICYGHIDDLSNRHRTTGKEYQEIKNFQVYILNDKGEKTNIILKPTNDCWEGTFTPTKEGNYRILGINDQQPVLVRSKNPQENIRPVDFLCSVYRIGNSPEVSPQPMQYLDIILQQKDNIYTILPYRNMKPSDKGTAIRIFNPENWEKNIQLNENHQAFFKPTIPGLYVIRQDWYDNTSGIFQGTAYGKIRYRNNYCLWIN
ncbi:hypothetical protein [Elizabethkingia ursingii]|nr:hypothetical protein [Elizabethkingia ursingii]